ncbi:efflux RND transporter periplasmic adaptor subunit [Flavobacterium arcticum]|uniref:Efflux RND transporter periplasmic adaptor subunit n=1 Tax=Flavobacterium arcticum TaxID=1784713 RepID=A0A345H9X0_9FLAO|nr:efflux RND transporter periplasmic adaptor subunit [Flavobacterium arcticum]AXG73380.1 efflux RND transporter periplasmic adaptor subunit [Flavobacterium arcticum]KAF2513170.1 efflux RND transporter periplasmic adaptor subunit [Flavobacterium arcticum]
MSKKTLYYILGITLVVIILLVVLNKTGAFGSRDESKEVETAKVETITLTETVSATGKIQPEVEVKISSEVSGEIIELPVKEGQAIKKGQLLIRINPDLYESGLSRTAASLSTAKAGLSQTEAQLKEAKANYDRNKTLFDKGVISKSEWDKIVSAYEVAQASKQSAYFSVQSAGANVTEAKDNLNRTTIYSPVDGTISKLDAELGERVVGTQQMAGTEILRVANLNNMEVEVDVNENDIVKIQIGDQADIEVDAYLKRKFKGVVTSISNSASSDLTADQVTNFEVKVRINKESYADMTEGKPSNYSPFRPGMTATVDIITERKENIIAVPISAVVVKSDTTAVKKDIIKELEEKEKEIKGEASQDEKFECVFVMKAGVAVLRPITTGIQDDTNIEVITGLKKGEEVITGPYTTVTKELSPNDKVRVKNKDNDKEDK